MTAKHGHDPQFDLFVPILSDLEFRDARETMERPFFSLSKRKRLQPISYTSPDGSVFVNVLPHQNFGMATIWDADLLIWAASELNALKKRGVNDPPRTLRAHPYELLKTIGRGTGGYDLQLLMGAIDRLKSTIIKTSIRAPQGKDEAIFSWLDSGRYRKRDTQHEAKPIKLDDPAGIAITVSDWFYNAVMEDKALLAIDPAYFSITGGRERWLYRVVRKHAGGHGPDGVPMKFTTLFEKSGAEGEYRRFKFELLKIIHRNSLPGFDLMLEGRNSDKEPWLVMARKGPWPEDRPLAAPKRPDGITPPLSDLTLALARNTYPGLDVYALKADFDAWISEKEQPADYQKAFYGFVKQRAVGFHAP